MRKFLQATALTALAMAAFGCASDADPKHFVPEAAQGGMTEVQLGTLAIEHAGSNEVRRFGQMMVTDHTQANTELKALAKSKSIEVPPDITSEQKSLADKLTKLNGAEFDKEYVDAMVKDHEHDVEDFQEQANTGSDAEVKAYAAKTLPTLQKHLQMIRDIKSKM